MAKKTRSHDRRIEISKGEKEINGFGDENGGLFKLISISPSDILGRYPVGNLVRSRRVTT